MSSRKPAAIPLAVDTTSKRQAAAIASANPSSASKTVSSPTSAARPSVSRNASSSLKTSPGPSQVESPTQVKKTQAPPPIDMNTFQQILELDDDDEHEYSKELTDAFFAQAKTTFNEMDKAYSKKDLHQLSSLGHFLKGSSAALGVSEVSAACQKIEHYGKLRDEKANKDLSPEDALARISTLLGTVPKECKIAEKWLEKWYKDAVAQ